MNQTHDGSSPAPLSGQKPLDWTEDGGKKPQTEMERPSTGMGYGHLADVHAVRSSTTPAMHLRFPKTITG